MRRPRLRGYTMPAPKPDEHRLDKAFEENDEITLAGITRQEMALYGHADGESKLKRLLGKVGDTLGHVVGRQPKSGK